jgi:hypothetical protein
MSTAAFALGFSATFSSIVSMMFSILSGLIPMRCGAILLRTSMIVLGVSCVTLSEGEDSPIPTISESVIIFAITLWLVVVVDVAILKGSW